MTLVSIGLWLLVTWYALTQAIPRAEYTVIFVGIIILVYTLDEWEVPENTTLDKILIIASGSIGLVTTGYLYTNFGTLNSVRVGYALQYEYVLAALFTLSVMYIIYRSYGATFLSIVVIGIVYALFGNYIPGILGHGGLSPTRILQILLLDLAGFFGFLTQLTAAWIALFMLFAGLLQAFGALELTERVGIRISEYIKSGVAQTAVFASIVIGSINGSTAANTAMTGSFTIPMMKESGIKAKTAGGIESVASTIGQVMPPVMGAAGFIMASNLSVAYVEILSAAVIPAVILILCITIGVHYTSIKQIDVDEIELDLHVEDRLSRTNFAIFASQFVIPIGVLIYTLGVLQWTVMTAGLYTCITMVIVGFTGSVLQNSDVTKTNSSNEVLLKNIKEASKKVVNGLQLGAKSVAPITIILLAINGVVDILLATGVPSALSLALMDISGGYVSIALILAMVISIVMGLGMPTAAAYTVVATLIAPTLINTFIIDPFVAHFFVFYCAILASVTPPIATSVAVATGIAESRFWPTAFEAVKISAPLFVLPFTFVANPELVTGSISVETMYHTGIVTLGAISIIHGLNFNWQSFTKNRIYKYTLMTSFVILGCILMISPIEAIRFAAIAALAVLGILQKPNISSDMRKRYESARGD